MRTNERRVRLSLVVGVAVTAAGCGPQQERAQTATLLQPPSGAVTCPSYGADGSNTVGQQGGSVAAEHEAPRGTRTHVLTIPAGAVAAGEQITFRVTEPQNGFVVVNATHNGGAMRFEPKLTLTLSYRGCTAPDTTGLRIYRRVGSEWSPVDSSTLDTASQSVSAPRDTLSQYALGAG
jgi:hypothetical protein